MKYRILFSLIILAFQAYPQLKCGQDIDLNTWIREGSESDGTWTVSADGNSVEQSINGEPTFFVSPDTFINVIMEGKIKVNTANDDDLVGFVFGYKDPSGPVTPTAMNVETYVFDWKQRDQTDNGGYCQEGYALYKVDGLIDYTDYPGSTGPVFWARENTPVSTLLQTNYGDNGWNDFQEYNFRLKYTAWNITIWIDDEEIINIDECNEPGRFGFYNSSQNFVIYSDFSYQYIADFDVINPDICVDDTGRFTIGYNDCPYSDFYPHGTTFDWEFGDGDTGAGRSQKHKYSEQGDYEIKLSVTDPLGCVDTSLHTIRVDWLDVGPAGEAEVCEGEKVEIDATYAGAVSYDWSNGESDPIISVNASGIYVATIEDSTGCLGFDTTVVDIQPIPTVDIGNDTSLCIGDTIGLKAQSNELTYTWSNGANSSETTVLEPGLYWVVVESSAGCIGGDSVLLDVAQLELDLPDDIKVCASEAPVTITAEYDGHPYIKWNTGDTTAEINVDNSQDLIAEIYDGLGCSAIDTMNVYIEEDPIVTLPNDTFLCEGNSLTLQGDIPGFTSTWSGPMFNQEGNNIGITQSGTYVLDVSSPLNCSAEDSINVDIIPNPIVNLGNDTIACFDDAPRWYVSGGLHNLDYLWSTGDTASSILINREGKFSVIATNEFGCSGEDDYVVEGHCPHGIYFPNAFTPNNDGVNDYFPTPNYNLRDYTLRIYNRWGQLLFVGENVSSVWDGKFNGQDCQTDVYVWKVNWTYTNRDDEVVPKSRVGRVSLIR